MRRGGSSAVLYVPGDGVYSDKTAACSDAILVENAPLRRKYA